MLVFKGLALALLQGQSIGPFPETFQHLSSGFLPELTSSETLRTTSLVIGLFTSVFTAVVCTRIIYDWRLAHRRLTTISI